MPPAKTRAAKEALRRRRVPNVASASPVQIRTGGDEHVSSVDGHEALRAQLQERLSVYLRRGHARVVLTDNTHTMVTIKRGDGVTTFRVHHMFMHAPSSIVRALVRYAERSDRDAAAVLRRYVERNEPAIRKDPRRDATLDWEGKYFNLQRLFDELNARYFEGRVRARITWGPRGKRRPSRDSIKLGSYTVEDELIRIHPILDAADVPSFFLEWVIFHEMLHEVHDMPIVDGRRVYHTPAFRRAEASFERYTEAVMWERMNLHRLLER